MSPARHPRHPPAGGAGAAGRPGRGGGRGAARAACGRRPGATVHTHRAYNTTTSGCDATTGGNGVASCNRSISRATHGYTVVVDVIFLDSTGKQLARTPTRFPPP